MSQNKYQHKIISRIIQIFYGDNKTTWKDIKNISFEYSESKMKDIQKKIQEEHIVLHLRNIFRMQDIPKLRNNIHNSNDIITIFRSIARYSGYKFIRYTIPKSKCDNLYHNKIYVLIME